MWLECLEVLSDQKVKREIHLNINASKNILNAFPVDFSMIN